MLCGQAQLSVHAVVTVAWILLIASSPTRLAQRPAERERLGKEQTEVNAQIERLTKLLSSDFAAKAPVPVVQKGRDKLADYQARIEKLKEQIERLE